MSFKIEWIDAGRESTCAPNPAHPNGVDLDMASSLNRACTAVLPYPAKRCGYYHVECKSCGLQFAVTTAGRADDPRSVRVNCKGISH